MSSLTQCASAVLAGSNSSRLTDGVDAAWRQWPTQAITALALACLVFATGCDPAQASRWSKSHKRPELVLKTIMEPVVDEVRREGGADGGLGSGADSEATFQSSGLSHPSASGHKVDRIVEQAHSPGEAHRQACGGVVSTAPISSGLDAHGVGSRWAATPLWEKYKERLMSPSVRPKPEQTDRSQGMVQSAPEDKASTNEGKSSAGLPSTAGSATQSGRQLLSARGPEASTLPSAVKVLVKGAGGDSIKCPWWARTGTGQKSGTGQTSSGADLQERLKERTGGHGAVEKPGAVVQSAEDRARSSDTADGVVSTQNPMKLVELNPNHTDLKTVGEVIISLREKVAVSPKSPILRLNLGTYLMLAGDYEGAASEFKKAMALNPADPVARLQLARILDFVGDHNSALVQYRQALGLAPNAALFHLFFAESLIRGGNISEGINTYRQAIGLDPTAEALSGLSEALLSSGDTIGAIKAARHAVSLAYASARAQVALTNALLKSGELQSALRTARQATLLNPTSPESHMVLGRCLYATGNLSQAVEEFKQAVAFDPLSAEARNDLGYALYGNGDILSAVNEYRLALRINPKMVEARNNLEVAIYGLSGESKR